MKKAEQLYSELSELIPEIKKHPEKWKAFVSEMLEKMPPQSIDEGFKKRLKNEVMATFKEKYTTQNASQKSSSWFAKWKWWLGGVGSMAFLFLISFSVWNPQQMMTSQSPSDSAVFEMAMEDTEEVYDEDAATSPSHDFFALSTRESGLMESLELEPEPISGSLAPQPRSEIGMLRIAPQEKINYEFEYIGDSVDLPSETFIYGKDPSGATISNDLIDAFLEDLEMDVLDLETLSSPELQRLSLTETIGELPYHVNIDYEGMDIRISSDYEVWQQQLCSAGDCDQKNFTQDDLPEDEVIIGWAKELLDHFEVSLENTGTPQLQKPRLLEFDEEMPTDSIDPQMMVIFPHLILEQPVHNRRGRPLGISVDVDLVFGRATGAQIPIVNFRSEEAFIRSWKEILDLARNGGYGAPKRLNDPDHTVQLELGTPTWELRQLFREDDTDSEAMIVEVLVFPVMEGSASVESDGGESDETSAPARHWPREMVVPLAEGFE